MEHADIIKMISVVYRKTQMYLNLQTQDVGITSGQIPFIMITCERGEMQQHQFCDILDIDKSTVAKMLGKLEHQGYVTRTPNPTDNRSIDVRPTEKAHAIYPMLRQIGEDWATTLTQDMTKIEQAIFFEMLQKTIGRAMDYFDNIR